MNMHAIFPGYKKAFDKVQHGKLLAVLVSFGAMVVFMTGKPYRQQKPAVEVVV